ncbi:OB-fold nucleic acid binding domain-containing protein, partial [Pseudoxanthobacter sp.]|uniref:helix-hairpin-helix domain-containing protein n=1 Tax=Pseudoxanthobacter sp. TaxID=1925742 RepID=UPI002FE330BD
NDFRREAERLKIAVLPPLVNRSGAVFDVIEGRIAYALGAVKGVGRSVVDHIVEMRNGRPFRDMGDFARRINPKIVNKRALEALACAGAFDDIEPNRARVVNGLDVVLAEAAHTADGAERGQSELFGGAGPQPLKLPATDPWMPAEKLNREHATIGFYLSAHPLDEYRPLLKSLGVQMWEDFQAAVKRGAGFGRLVGTVTQRQERKTRTGNRMGIVRMSDPTGQYEAVCFSETLAQVRDQLEPGQSVVLMVAAEEREEQVSVRIQSVESLEAAAQRKKRSLKVFLKDESPLDALSRQLPAGGDGEVSVILMLDEGRREIEMRLPGRYKVSPPLAGALRAVPGIVDVEFA